MPNLTVEAGMSVPGSGGAGVKRLRGRGAPDEERGERDLADSQFQIAPQAHCRSPVARFCCARRQLHALEREDCWPVLGRAIGASFATAVPTAIPRE